MCIQGKIITNYFSTNNALQFSSFFVPFSGYQLTKLQEVTIMVLALISSILQFLTFEDITIDSWIFKLFRIIGFALFLIGSTVGMFKEHFGDPITCNFKDKWTENYCWLHGTSYIDEMYQKYLKCTIDLNGIVTENEAPDTSYYQVS